MEIPRTLNVVIECWRASEAKLQVEIDAKWPDADEEFITRLFHGTFAEELRQASREHRIENAFREDLEAGFLGQDIDHQVLPQIANGLIATATLHNKGAERLTGGDLGLVLARPELQQTFHDGGAFDIKDRRSGLLVQAKLRAVTGQWGKLTPSQKKVLKGRLLYTALLLYEFSNSENRRFLPFKWQPLRLLKSIREIESCLKGNSFPSQIQSVDLIRQLDRGEIGTLNARLIDEVISPSGNTWLEVRIDWPDGKGPGSQVLLHSRYVVSEQVKVFA